MKLSRSRFYAICVFFISVQVHFSIWFFSSWFTLCVRIQFASENACTDTQISPSNNQQRRVYCSLFFLTFTSEYMYFVFSFFERNSFANRCAIRSTNWCFVHFDLVLCFRIFKFDTPVRGTFSISMKSHFYRFTFGFPIFCGLLFFCPFGWFFVRIICVMPFGAQIVDEMFIDST